MIKKNKSKNPLSALGIDDMEICKTFNLPPDLAYTDGLKKAACDLMYVQNVKNFQKYEKMNENDAKREAGRLRAEAMSI